VVVETIVNRKTGNIGQMEEIYSRRMRQISILILHGNDSWFFLKIVAM
jgi:hypothetical protein